MNDQQIGGGEQGKTLLSRREFLKAAAAGAAGAAAAGALGACATAAASSGGIAGSGGAPGGLSSALNHQDYDYRKNSIKDFARTTLFSSWRLGPLTLGHRMVKSAAFQLAFLRGIPEEYISYYERMAKGGVEMIWIEDFAAIWKMTSSPFKQPMEAYDVRRLVDRLHAAGAYLGYQFDTMGSPIGPLDFEKNFLGDYSTEEVKSWIQDIIAIGKRLKDLGFDAYELNFAANNLGQSFLSRARNNRTDEYGPQTLESRTKFAVEIIQGVKRVCGKDFIVQMLINGIEENDRVLGDSAKYNSLEEVIEIARIIERAGADSLHLRLGPAGQHVAQFANDLYFTARGFEGSNGYGASFDFSRHFQGKLRANHSGCGMMIDVAGEVKKAVSIPVGAATYMDPAHAPDYFEAALAEGKLDFLVMNRPLCVDPEYVNKLRANRIDEIAPCTRCLHCFYDPDMNNTPGLLEHCRVNAANWRAYGPQMPEGWDPKPGSGAKKVMVIGGGPAGMEAARVAAQRGYTVTLYEKAGTLGGLLPAAEFIKGPHENLGRLASYLARQLEIAGVRVLTGTEVTPLLIASEAPEAVILAAGGIRGALGLQGTPATRVLSFNDSLRGSLGKNITIVGGNCQAVDYCVYLLAQGKNVTIVMSDPMEKFEKGHSVNVRGFVQTAINSRGTRIWPSAAVKSVGSGSVTITAETGIDVTYPCDAVIEMMDMLPNTALIDGLSGVKAVAVGDCLSPYNIAEAIASANLAARGI